LAVLEEAEVEDAPCLYSQRVTRLGGAGGYSRTDPILISFVHFWVRRKVSGISLLRLFPDFRSSLASAKL